MVDEEMTRTGEGDADGPHQFSESVNINPLAVKIASLRAMSWSLWGPEKAPTHS
jgi:hypothetical protein